MECKARKISERLRHAPWGDVKISVWEQGAYEITTRKDEFATTISVKKNKTDEERIIPRILWDNKNKKCYLKIDDLILLHDWPELIKKHADELIALRNAIENDIMTDDEMLDKEGVINMGAKEMDGIEDENYCKGND